ncbi:MAG: NADH-quinone oxidoreductase subunit N [Nitrospiraceae bacterium]|nr:NADH-quinone oxidoreductase subunit N [Nitrospiraceae bacterium]
MLPEALISALAITVILLDLVIRRKQVLAWITVAGSAGVFYSLFSAKGFAFNRMFLADGYGIFFKAIFLISLALCSLISVRYLSVEGAQKGEYFGLMLFATVGMMVMASAPDLITVYLGLELMSLSVYALAGFIRNSPRSSEAALKYFMLGAFASAFLLLGIALAYGMTGTTSVAGIAQWIQYSSSTGASVSPLLVLSMILLVAAFAFKISAVPFHMWTPDVYEGAPTPVTAFMSVGPKAAGFAVIGRVILVAFSSLRADWVSLLIVLSILSMVAGNILAIAQTNIKRMLAYSSIAHAGYALLGIVTFSPDGLASMMNYLLIYAFMNIGAFTVVIMARVEGQGGEEIQDYAGLSRRSPFVAFLMLLFMFSLTGIPPTAGFMGKFYIFSALINAGYTWLAVIAVVMSAVSAYFYLRVVMYMYMKEPLESATPDVADAAASAPGLKPYGARFAVLLAGIAVLLIGILPTPIIQMARAALYDFGS